MIERALAAKRESKTVDLKRSFDASKAADWCEIVKYLVSANSGGGAILIGVEDDGSPATPGSASAILGLDPAKITDKVAKYTGIQFDGFNARRGREAWPSGRRYRH
jgi:predicted HTH transcriptional regulator